MPATGASVSAQVYQFRGRIGNMPPVLGRGAAVVGGRWNETTCGGQTQGNRI